MKKNLLFAVACLGLVQANAQTKKYWRTAGESLVSKNAFANHVKPASYKLFTLDETALKNDLQLAPLETNISSSKSNTVITLPSPDGNLKDFIVRESPVMEEGLAVKFPGIKSYSGKATDNSSATVRFTVTKLGFHAMVTSGSSITYYVNCLDKKSSLYMVNDRDNVKGANTFSCQTDQVLLNDARIAGKKTPFTGNADDSKLRTYRLALCVTGEFSRYFMTGDEVTTADSIATVLSAITVHLARANEVYERDFGVRMVFVNDEEKIIYLDPKKDPFSFSLNSQCQNTCDSKIGNTNYDIGHVVQKGSDNGSAGCIGCVCKTGSKGSGYSTYSKPDLLDPFVIDYWTHEMGHQFGANHTYTYSNEGSGANLEPGSGSTIMGYAGITGSTDVQDHSDDYFHAASIAQVTNYLKTGFGNTCGVVSESSNPAPVVENAKNFTIPKSTPFALKGRASDENDGKGALIYMWEQIDQYVSGKSNTFPKATSKEGPLFRSIKYSSNPERTFPDMATILSGQLTNKWEALPSVERTMNFRLTVWDNHPGSGANSSSDNTITVDAGAGPFKVTSQNGGSDLWTAGDTKTITWDVANTDGGNVNCTKVNILLSTDDGQTFDITLARHTANDGSENITVPDVDTKKARIKIEANRNIFFDITDKKFEIQPAAAKVVAVQQRNWKLQPNPAVSSTTLTAAKTLNHVQVTITSLQGRTVYTKNINKIDAGSRITIPLSQLFKGTYIIKLSSDEETNSETLLIQ